MIYRCGKIEECDILVYVSTYNHAPYIKQCLDSILEQKGVFDLLIVVHDDCSTDGTQEILKDYYDKNSEKFILIIEDTNQFSKGNNNPFLQYLDDFPKCKYIALVEGDDYLSSDNKFQKQFDVLEKNFDCVACLHAASLYDEKEKIFRGIIPSAGNVVEKNSKLNRDYYIQKLIIEGGIFSSNSYFFRSSLFRGKNFDHDFWYCWSGDLSISLYLFLSGTIYYLPEALSVKRINNIGSFSEQSNRENQKYKDIEVYKNRLRQTQKQLLSFDEMSDKKYHFYIENKLLRNKIWLAAEMRNTASPDLYFGEDYRIYHSFLLCRIGNRLYRLANVFVSEPKRIVRNNKFLRKQLRKYEGSADI